MLTINPKTKLILADVDETIADVYTDATPEMIDALSNLLSKGVVVFLISGGGYKSIYDRVVAKLKPELRQGIIMAHCSGAEVVGYDKSGNRIETPFYSLYDQVLSDIQKTKWRELMKEIIKEFNLKTFDPSPVNNFREKISKDPLSVMYSDRGPQITIEFVNSFNLTQDQIISLGYTLDQFPTGESNLDLRDVILPFAKKKIAEYNIPIEIDYGGEFAMDFKLFGVNKTVAVKYILENEKILKSFGLDPKKIDEPEEVEIWGDKFSEIRGGSDRYMSFALNPRVRSIDFRREDPKEFPKGYNIVIWDGEKRLHEGTLEYLNNSIFQNPQ